MMNLNGLTDQLPINQTFRTVHYLGSKLRFLDFIEDVLDEIDPKMGGICDLFAGSGSVSQHMSENRKVVSVDVQNYSTVICSALLNPVKDSFTESFVEQIHDSGIIAKNLSEFHSIIELEEELINGSLSTNLELICDFLEHSSLYSAMEKLPKSSIKLKQALSAATIVIHGEVEARFLVTKYFGGIFFSYKQAVVLDSILENILQAETKYKDTLLAALLSTASDIVNTIGKQFAQPIRPRDKAGNPKKGLANQLRKDRNLNVLDIYDRWLQKYSKRPTHNRDHLILNMDFKKAFQYLDESISTVYADPPYTRDHYSRFYHGLETICLMDYPTISTTNFGGRTKLSRGLYRTDRHQSEFCIKSKAPKAFDYLFKQVSSINKNLVLSYSPYDKSKGSHPRVVELKFLQNLASNYFCSVEIRSLGRFSHSKLNRTDLHLSTEEDSEVLLVCTNHT